MLGDEDSAAVQSHVRLGDHGWCHKLVRSIFREVEHRLDGQRGISVEEERVEGFAVTVAGQESVKIDMLVGSCRCLQPQRFLLCDVCRLALGFGDLDREIDEGRELVCRRLYNGEP